MHQINMVALLLNFDGDAAYEIFDNLRLNEDDDEDFQLVLQNLDDRISPKQNVTYLGYKFNMRTQNEESFENFLSELQKLPRNCVFRDEEDNMIRNHIVIGMQDKKLQEECFRYPDLTLDEAIQKCRVQETSLEEQRKVGTTEDKHLGLSVSWSNLTANTLSEKNNKSS